MGAIFTHFTKEFDLVDRYLLDKLYATGPIPPPTDVHVSPIKVLNDYGEKRTLRFIPRAAAVLRFH